jgi:hypothetical protein
MSEFSHIGKIMIVVGLIIAVVGFVLFTGGKIPKIPWLGHLPGDISIKGEKSSFYFPITTCILISIVLTFILSLFRNK